MAFPHDLRDARRAARHSQAAAAEALGITQQQLSKWENGEQRPQPKHLPALATYLGISAEEVAVRVALGNNGAGDAALADRVSKLEDRVSELADAFAQLIQALNDTGFGREQ